MTDTAPRLDDVIHPPHRLQLCAMLASVDALAFATARESLELSESALSKQVKILQNAGYVSVTKSSDRAHLRTWLVLTPAGRAALTAHLAALRSLARVAGAEPASG